MRAMEIQGVVKELNRLEFPKSQSYYGEEKAECFGHHPVVLEALMVPSSDKKNFVNYESEAL